MCFSMLKIYGKNLVQSEVDFPENTAHQVINKNIFFGKRQKNKLLHRYVSVIGICSTSVI